MFYLALAVEIDETPIVGEAVDICSLSSVGVSDYESSCG